MNLRIPSQLIIALCNPIFQLFGVLILIYSLRWFSIFVICLPFLLFPTISIRRVESDTFYGKIWKVILAQIRNLVNADVKVIKSKKYRELALNHKAMICVFPHGVMPASVYIWLENERNFVIHTVALVLLNPVLRFFLVGCRGGFALCSKSEIRNVVNKGMRPVLWPGGIKESLIYNEIDPVCKTHSGFVHFAQKEKITLIPVYVDGEEHIIHNLVPFFTKWCYKCFGIPLSFPYWANKCDLTVYFGDPVYPKESVEETLKEFWAEFEKLRKHHNNYNKIIYQKK